jgi:putative membrane protein
MLQILADTRYYGPGPWFLIFPLFWFGFIALLFFTIGRRRWRGPWSGGGRSVLDERFARGEITADEYRERRAVLEEGRR